MNRFTINRWNIMATLRPATTNDADSVIAMTRAQRHQLADWSPVYFNPRAGSDQAHAGFLRFLLGSDDHATFMIEDDGLVVGFVVYVPQANHSFVDDLCVTNGDQWPQVVAAVTAHAPHPWVTCISVHDTARLSAFATADFDVRSTYYARLVERTEGAQAARATSLAPDPALAPPHTFGGTAFAPNTPGALVVTDEAGGYAIGSPSASPPIFDPGGPTCVIDQVVGEDRNTLLKHACATAAARGDAQIVVVAAADDHELTHLLTRDGFEAVVHLVGS